MEGIELLFYVKKKYTLYLIILCTLIAGLFLFYKYHLAEAKIINVRDYGAKGDGITDDTSAVQTAFNKVTKSKTKVYFPSGTYMVNPNKNVLIKSNANVAGDGESSIIKANNAEFGWSLLYISGRNIKISKLSFDGNNAVNRVLVVQAGSSNVQLSNSLVANASQSSDRSSDFYSEVVTGITVYGNTNSISFDQTEIRNIIALHPLGGSLIARGIYITNTSGLVEKTSTNLAIINSNIHDIGPADDGDGIYYEDPYLDKNIIHNTNSTIANNTFYNCAKRAIKLYANGISVTGNYIVNDYLNNNYYQGKDKGKLAPDMYAGISVYGNNIKIAKNILAGKGSYYAAIEVTSSKMVKNIEVSENKITMGAQSNKKGTTSIRMGDIEDFTIASNVLENGERGIWSWQNATRGTITENIVNMPDGGGIDLSTYLANYNQINIRCTNNMITAKDFNIRVPKGNSTIQLD
jgi:hypothetical protein